MSGRWIFVCGPSGAGKDSVMAWAGQQVSVCRNIVFARRIVTRPVHSGSDHDPLSESEFLALEKSGGLCWQWQAHGFHYGIAAHYAETVSAGCSVVVNGSRAHVLGLERSPALKVVEITAGSAQLTARLSRRGREDRSAIEERLARNADMALVAADLVIANNGALSTSGQRLADYLLEIAGSAAAEGNRTL